MKSIVMTGGGSGGHCLPHYAIYPYIKSSFENFYYIGSISGIEKTLMSKTFEYFAVPTAKLRRSFSLENLTILQKVIQGEREAERILARLRPAVVFSKGGYVAVPVVLAAHKLKIPVVSHESDYTLGLANKIAAPRSKFVLTSFEDTAKSLKNGIFTGAPIRRMVQNKTLALEKFGLTNGKPVLLVIGGSGGSQSINLAIRRLLPSLLENYQVLHVCGTANVAGEKFCGYKEVGYLDNVEDAYTCADTVVSRAGAGVCFELTYLKKPTLFIPLPKRASRGDQILNANYFLKRGTCNVLYEEDMTLQSLTCAINQTFAERKKLISAMKTYPDVCGNEKISSVLKLFS